MDQNNASPKKMNVGLIGAGFMAKAHSIAYAGMPMFFWPAPIIPVKKMIVDMNEAIAREAKDKFAFESYSTDWHDVVNNPEIDVVDICTPNNVHAEIAIAAAKAGKHIICEKPLALTYADSVELFEKAASKKRVLTVGTHYRFTDPMQLCKAHVDGNFFGNIYAARTTYCRRSGIPGYRSWFTNQLQMLC